MTYSVSLGGGLPNAYSWKAVAFNADRSVAIAVTDDNGVSPIVAVSNDGGLTWSSQSPPSAMRYQTAIACDGTKFCMLSWDGVTSGYLSSTTTDGITWETPGTITATSGSGFYGLVWDGTNWICGKYGFSGSGTVQMYTSSDGLAWTERNFTGERNISWVAGNSVVTYAISYGGSPRSKLYKSTDHGVTWSACTELPATPDNLIHYGGWYNAIIVGDGNKVLVHDDASHYYAISTDQGVTWEVDNFGAPTYESYYAGAWDGVEFVLPTWNKFFVSTTGRSPWTLYDNPDPNQLNVFGIYGDGGYVIGAGNDVSFIAYDPELYYGAYILNAEAVLSILTEKQTDSLLDVVTVALLTSSEIVSLLPVDSYVYVDAVPGVVPSGYSAPDTSRPDYDWYPKPYPQPQWNLIE